MINLYQDILSANSPKDNALIFMGHKMSRKALFNNIENMAGFLSSIGIGKGDVVGILSPNLPSVIVGFYAINKLGAVSNIFHPLVATNDLIKKLKSTGTKCIFVYDLFYQKHKKALKELGIKIIICSAKDYMDKFTKFVFSLGLDLIRGVVKNEYTQRDFTKKYPKVENVYNEDCCLLHSSGTEKEKTVILTNENFIELNKKMVDVIGEEFLSKERLLVSLPIFHCFGLGVGVHSGLAQGDDLVVMPTFNTKQMVRLVNKYQVTVLTVIPSMLRKFIKHGFSSKFTSVRHIYCGGDRLSSKLRNQFNSLLNENNDIKIMEGYGLTELTGVCIVNTEKNYKEGSIGKPILGVKAVALSDNDEVLPFNQTGELALCSSTVMKGYYDGSNNLINIGGDNYFKTGDLVHIDNDGYIYYDDRKKDIIKISGINVFPKDIEELVLTIKGVKEAVCVEKAINNKPYVYLYVVGENSEELKQKIFDIVKENMLKYYWLKDVVFLDKMPYTKNGKIDKKQLESKVKFN